MALTGVRGLIAITTVTLPVTVVFLTLFVTLPRVGGRADVGRGARPGRAARAALQHHRPRPGRRPGRDERHLAARRRHPADGHHRPPDGVDAWA
ncbi:MAG: hypothetical protein MZV63_58620 [Marinilabiliales bacterium]|nr:hypothetical protein [Marinilabiliales bacterium]